MSPAGNILVVSTESSDGEGYNNEEYLYHFNGAKPPTKFTTFEVAGPPNDEGNQVVSMQWDKNNHLYLLNSSWDGVVTISVYTITTTSAKLTKTYTVPGWISDSPALVVRSN